MAHRLFFLACTLCCLLGVILSPSHAAAQTPSGGYSTPSLPALDPAKRIPPVEIVRVDVGSTPDGMIRNRQVPVRVWLTSREQPFSGVLTVTFPQDATQRARYMMEVSTTPGAITSHEFSVFLPLDLEWLEVEVNGDSGRATRRLEQYADNNSLMLPPDTGDQFTVLVVGDLPFVLSALEDGRSTVEQLQDNGQSKKRSLWDSVQAVPLAPESMFLCWPSYESADLVIASADALSAADPRALNALRTWTQSGGRLIIVADNAGPLWQSLWADSTPMALSVSDLRSVRPAASLIGLLSKDSTVQASTDLRFSARLTQLTPWGVQHGWTASLEVEGADAGSKGTLFAHGPFGGGQVGVLTAEPQRMSKTLSAAAAQIVYRHLAELLAPTSRVRWLESLDSNSPWNSRYTREAASRQAFAALIEGANEFPDIGPFVFILISLAMLLMGLLIGPIDGLLTRRRTRRGLMTWWSAMGWITLASIVAVLAPSLVRSGKTYLNHAQAVDVICDASGASTQWTTDYFATFAGKPIQFGLPMLADGAWCRGVSVMDPNDGAGTAFTPLLLPISVGQSGERQAHPLPVSQNQWTLRTLVAVSPAHSSTIGASIIVDEKGAHLKLTGLPEDALVTKCEVEAVGSAFIVDQSSVKVSQLDECQLRVGPKKDTESRRTTDPFLDGLNLEGGSSSVTQGRYLEDLTGFQGRTDTLRSLQASANAATVHLQLTQLPPGTLPSGLDEASTQQNRSMRLRATFLLSPEAIEALTALTQDKAK